MAEPLLRIQNRHSLSCGDPPIIDGSDPDLYVGYFENRHGEQWVFTFHRKTREAVLRGGDIGWNNSHAVKNGAVDLVLSAEESAWLSSCWAAAQG